MMLYRAKNKSIESHTKYHAIVDGVLKFVINMKMYMQLRHGGELRYIDVINKLFIKA